MRKELLASLALVATLVGGSAFADTPIDNREVFERQYIKCLEGSELKTCLPSVLGGHFSPGNEKQNSAITDVFQLVTKWLGTDRVFEVHPVKVNTLGKFFDERIYVIEDTGGNMLLMSVVVMRQHGNLYLHRLRVELGKEAFEKGLGVEL